MASLPARLACATLLNIARAVEDTILTCAGVYRVTGERKYTGQATAEMLSAATGGELPG